MTTYTITAGHGDGDPGASYGGYTEAGLMAELRDLVARRLRERGHTVRTDGEEGRNRALTYALTLIPGSGLALDLHCNAFVNPAAGGVETVSSGRHKDTARRISRAIADALGTRVRGDGGWIDQSATPRGRLAYVMAGGLIVETFFLSNPEELAAYMVHKHDVAEAIAEAVTA